MTQAWTPTPPNPPKPSTVSRPLIGMAICACLFVVAVLTGVVTLCGGSSSQSTTSLFSSLAIILAISSFLGGVACFIWFIVRLISDSHKS